MREKRTRTRREKSRAHTHTRDSDAGPFGSCAARPDCCCFPCLFPLFARSLTQSSCFARLNHQPLDVPESCWRRGANASEQIERQQNAGARLAGLLESSEQVPCQAGFPARGLRNLPLARLVSHDRRLSRARRVHRIQRGAANK